MKSQPVTIGGHDWQIKFYPKGNDSDYLSVYIECVSVQDKKEPSPQKSQGGQGEDTAETVAEASSSASPSSEDFEPQHAPLPLLGGLSLPKRKSVAAQIAVVMYNPNEPRVNHFRTGIHRFCKLSPDWGWTRFHGPYYDIAHRSRGQRQALLRDDKLALTAYIRIVDDETGCLWEHPTGENPWDSFAMTGLQSMDLSIAGYEHGLPGGNLISAIASWMMFKPFRQFLYSCELQSHEEDPFTRPKPLISALQKILFQMRTQVNPGDGPVSLGDVEVALMWYGIPDYLTKLDVIEVWEVLRSKLEEELRGTPHANILDDLFGPKKDYAVGVPSYRVPVIGVESMQGALDKAQTFIDPSQPLPQLLTVELERQEFDVATRSYVKLLNKVTLDDSITVRHTPYTLLGFIVHKQTLQSYVYHPVLRPEGPGSKWYMYTDKKEGNVVKCLTKRQAVDNHEGKLGQGKITGNEPVAYIALYVRADVADLAFTANADSEKWSVPEWIREEVEKEQHSSLPLEAETPPLPTEDATSSSRDESLEKASLTEKCYEFRVIDSRVFLQHEGPGIMDVYDERWQPGISSLIYSVQLKDTDGFDDIRNKLGAVVPDIQDPRQIQFWFVDAIHGFSGRPILLSTGEIEYSSGEQERFGKYHKDWTLKESPQFCESSRIWIHVVDRDSLRQFPKPKPHVPEPAPVPLVETSSSQTPPPSIQTPQWESVSPVPVPAEPAPADGSTVILEYTPPPPQEPDPQSEDTPMSEPDEPPSSPPEPQSPVVESPEAHTGNAQPAVPPINHPRDNIAMVEVEVEVAVESVPHLDPPTVDVVVNNSIAPTDTEMSGTQENLPPPPVFGGSQLEVAPPPPVPVQETPVMEEFPPDEVYFFLKLFDPESQTLQSRGSHIVLKSAKVDSTILSILGLPAEQRIELFIEDEPTTILPVRNRRTFASNNLHATIIIAQIPLTDEQRDALAARAAFPDLQSFLDFRCLASNFPARLNGHFTYDYFSAQYYKGEIKNGQRHGHGKRIYHSGATYEGTFRLGQRHGHGFYTFQNGDTYDGEWVANQQHGTGTFVEAATGNTYVGGWKNDKKFGEGVTHWKNAQETERLCRICWEDSADAAFYDCGHVVACLACARQVQSCPVCRKRVVSAMKLYYVA
jgi:hypothetical protein